MARRLTDPAFRADQWNRRFDPHVAPINRYVDEIRDLGYGWAPYVAPIHGGVDARVLSILRDPGPATQDGDAGSGFLCVENDDSSAQLQCELLDHAGLVATDLLPWNAYPWYINRKPSTAELLPRLAHDPSATRTRTCYRGRRSAGRRRSGLVETAAKTSPQALRTRRLAVVETYHPSRQALFTPDPAEQQRRRARRFEAFRDIAGALG